MKKTFLILSLLISQTFAFAQDNKVMKITKYIIKGKWTEARELLDELDNIPKYKNDIDYWFVRTCYYKAVIATHINSDNELYNIEIVEAKKSFEKLVEYDKTDTSKSYSEYIPQFRKEIYNGHDETINKSSNTSQSESSKSADNGKTVTLTEIGQGKTKEAAKYSALRSALEKAFGTFISSNTTIFKDELVKDEIVSVSSGNIQNFEILSETQMPDGSFSSVVKATVSIGKLTTFCESKGISVEFNGGAFAANVKIKELEEKNRVKGLQIFREEVLDILNNGVFNYTIQVDEPKKHFNDSSKYIVNIVVTAVFNENFKKIEDLIDSYGKGLNVNLYFSFHDNFKSELKESGGNFVISNGITSLKFRDILTVLEENDFSGRNTFQYSNDGRLHNVIEIHHNTSRINDYIFSYTFSQVLTLDEISKIKEYKVEPIK